MIDRSKGRLLTIKGKRKAWTKWAKESRKTKLPKEPQELGLETWPETYRPTLGIGKTATWVKPRSNAEIDVEIEAKLKAHGIKKPRRAKKNPTPTRLPVPSIELLGRMKHACRTRPETLDTKEVIDFCVRYHAFLARAQEEGTPERAWAQRAIAYAKRLADAEIFLEEHERLHEASRPR